MSDWWDDLLQPPSEDGDDTEEVEIGEYIVDETVEDNHNILADLRNNDFDLKDPAYGKEQLRMSQPE